MNILLFGLLFIALVAILAGISARKQKSIPHNNAPNSDTFNTSFTLPVVPATDASLEIKTDWILQCDMTLGASLGISEVFQSLNPESINNNISLIRKIASTYEDILRLGCQEAPLEEFGLTLLNEQLPASPYKSIIGFLWKFYCAAIKLICSDDKLRSWIRSQEVPSNPTTIQLYYILSFLEKSYAVTIQDMGNRKSNPVTDKMVNSMFDFMLKKEREGK